MRILIVDDEPLARDRLRAQVDELAIGEVVGEANDGGEALRLVAACSPDVVLMDIRMPGMDGLEAARHLARLPVRPAVIFTTAYDEHALAAFEASAVDYLLKPIRSHRLREAVDKARAMTATQAGAIERAGANDMRTHVSGVVHGALALVAVDAVLYFQADQGYTNVVTADGALLIEDSLKSLEDEFGERFIRIHRNALVAASSIVQLKRDAQGNHIISLRGTEVTLPVSRRLLQQVKQRLR